MEMYALLWKESNPRAQDSLSLSIFDNSSERPKQELKLDQPSFRSSLHGWDFSVTHHRCLTGQMVGFETMKHPMRAAFVETLQHIEPFFFLLTSF